MLLQILPFPYQRISALLQQTVYYVSSGFHFHYNSSNALYSNILCRCMFTISNMSLTNYHQFHCQGMWHKFSMVTMNYLILDYLFISYVIGHAPSAHTDSLFVAPLYNSFYCFCVMYTVKSILERVCNTHSSSTYKHLFLDLTSSCGCNTYQYHSCVVVGHEATLQVHYWQTM